MGSSLSVYNDTKHKVWIQQGANWEAVVGSVAAVLAVATLGVGAPISAASVAAVSAYSTNAGSAAAAEAATAAGATGSCTTGSCTTIVGLATSAGTSSALSYALKLSEEKAEELATAVHTFIDESEVLRPGKTFRYDSTLSMTRTVYVMNENGEIVDGTAWTGPTDGSDIRCV